MKKKIMFLGVLLLSFVLKIDGVYAKTCEYEMVPINYYINSDNKVVPTDKGYTNKARITYNSGKNKKFTTVYKFSDTKENHSFNDSSVSKSINKSGCPAYVRTDGKSDLKIVDKDEFLKYLNSFYNKSDTNHYPLVLVKEDGKTNNKTKAASATLIKATTDAWNILMNKKENENYTQDAGVVASEKAFRNSMKKLTNYNADIAKDDTWKNYVQTYTKKADLAQAENKQKTAAGDYCYFYCSDTHCASQKNATAKNECIKSCNNNEKKKCDQSYDACKNISSSSTQTQCIKGKLQENGLNAGYTETRNTSMAAVNNEVQQIRNSITKATKPSLNINFDANGYKVQCSDVAFLHIFWVIIEIAAPILVIVFGTIDFIVAIVASDENKMQKARKKFPKRLIAAVLLVISFSLISTILSFSSDANVKDTSLIRCIVSGQ